VKTVDQLQKENEELKQMQIKMAGRLETIVSIFQTKLLNSPIIMDSDTDGEAILLAIAELKQVKDILGGFLPPDSISHLFQHTSSKT